MSASPSSPPVAPTADEAEQAAVAGALRTASAATLCVIVTEWFHMPLTYMSVISVYVVLDQTTAPAFQKGIERLVGRIVGVGYGALIAVFFRDSTALYLVVLATGQLAMYYVNASGRFAYSALQGGAFMAAVACTGLTAPQTVPLFALHMLEQVVLGVVVALAVAWMTAMPRALALEPGGTRWLPLRIDWLREAAMLTTSSMSTLFLTALLNLPAVPSLISAVILSLSPDRSTMRRKGRQRALGAVCGGAYGFASLALLHYQVHFLLLLALCFFGIFVAGYYTFASKEFGYVALQAGMTITMVLLGETNEVGSFETAVTRFIGVWVGLLNSLAAHFLWFGSEKDTAAGSSLARNTPCGTASFPMPVIPR